MISEEGPRKEEKHNNMSNRSRETDKDLHYKLEHFKRFICERKLYYCDVYS